MTSLAARAGSLQDIELALQNRADEASNGLRLGLGLSAQLQFEGHIPSFQNGAIVADPKRLT